MRHTCASSESDSELIALAVIAIIGLARGCFVPASRIQLLRIEMWSWGNSSRLEVQSIRIEKWIGLERFATRKSLVAFFAVSHELFIKLLAAAVLNFPLLSCFEVREGKVIVHV